MNSYQPHHARPPTIARTTTAKGREIRTVAGAPRPRPAKRPRARMTAQPQTSALGDQAKFHEQPDTDTEPDEGAKGADVEEGAHREAAVAVWPG